MLWLTGFILAASASTIVGGAAYLAWDDDNLGDLRLKWAIYLGLMTVVMVLLVLLFFSTILLDSVSTAFVCFAIDRDNHQETRSKIHEVMGLMPSVGSASENNPDVRDRAYLPPAEQIIV